MKNTLKSLLFTTVLTLPSVFGAACADDKASSAIPIGSSVTASSSSTALSMAATTPKLMRKLIPDGAIYLILGNVQVEDIEFLGDAEETQLTPEILNFDITQGYLSFKDIYALARASRGWYNIFQSMIAPIKAWRASNVIPRLLQDPSLNHQDTQVLAFLGINTSTPFENILNIAFTMMSRTVSMTSDEHAALVAAIDGNETFTKDQKTILKGLLPRATPDDIKNAASALQSLGTTYYKKAEILYELSARHKDVTPQGIINAAYSLKKLESASSTKRAATVFELLANHPAAKTDNIRNAAYELAKFGSKFAERAGKLYKLFGKHPAAKPDDIIKAADELKRLLGPAYYKLAADLYEISARHKDAKPYEIMYAACGLFGYRDNEIVVALHELSARHKDVTPYDIIGAAYKLKDFGPDYYERAEALMKKAEELSRRLKDSQ